MYEWSHCFYFLLSSFASLVHFFSFAHLSFLSLFLLSLFKFILFQMVWFLWFVAAATYYGVVLLSTELLNSSEGVCESVADSAKSTPEKETECSLHTCR